MGCCLRRHGREAKTERPGRRGKCDLGCAQIFKLGPGVWEWRHNGLDVARPGQLCGLVRATINKGAFHGEVKAAGSAGFGEGKRPGV